MLISFSPKNRGIVFDQKKRKIVLFMFGVGPQWNINTETGENEFISQQQEIAEPIRKEPPKPAIIISTFTTLASTVSSCSPVRSEGINVPKSMSPVPAR